MVFNEFWFIYKCSFIVAAVAIVVTGRGYAEIANSSAPEGVREKGGTIKVYLTAKDTGDRLAEKMPVALEKGNGASATISIDPAVRFQEIVGFGGAFTEAAAYALSKIGPEKRAEVIRAYFDPVEGLGYSLCRTHINSCDFSLDNYCYTNGICDTELKDFSIERDEKLLIPLIRDAMATAGVPLKILASPWSPPAWMKTNGKMNHGGKLKPEYAGTWAKYLAKYIEAYSKEGIDIWGITIQNEPGSRQRWDSCTYSAEEERDFVKNYLGPTLSNENLGKVKIIVWDHNKNSIVERAAGVLSDPEAAKYVWGVGFHWYRGEHFDNLDKLNGMYPDKKLLSTEACIENGPRIGAWHTGEKYGHNIIGDLNHFAVGWVDWNIALDERGGPNHARNFCDAPVIADGRSNSIIYSSSFYYLGHFSKFIRPGAVRIGCTVNNPALEATAFLNVDGRIAVVVMNATRKEVGFTVGYGENIASLCSPAHSIQTLIFTP